MPTEKDTTLSDDALPDDFGGGDLAYLESYSELNVDNTVTKIKQDATNLVTELCKIYLKNHLIGEDDYIKAIAAIEINQLSSAMLATRSVEHALTTLLRQLDAGGYTNPEIFDQIGTLSKISLDLTLKSTQYLRSLPEFLKFTANEMRDNGLLRSVEILQDSAQVASAQQDEHSDNYDLSGPIMGTRSLMLQIRDAETDLDAVIKSSKEKQKIIETNNLKEIDEAEVINDDE